jgi:hypothetical protein
MERIAILSLILGTILPLSAFADRVRLTPQEAFKTEEKLRELLAEDELNEPVVLALCSNVHAPQKMDDVAGVIAKVRMRAAQAVEVSHKFSSDLERILENAKAYNKMINGLKRTCIWNMDTNFFARTKSISEQWRNETEFASEIFELKIEKKMEEIKKEIDRRNG